MLPNDAILSADTRYRYVLSRQISPWQSLRDMPYVLWVMVNPSTATATADDHTIRKVIGYCQHWGFPSFRVVNLYAYRSKDIDVLSFLEKQDTRNLTPAERIYFPVFERFKPTDIIGPDNDRHIAEQAATASEIIVAWGNRSKMPPSSAKRIPLVLGLLSGAKSDRTPIFCIGRTKSGDPKHPLTTPYSAPRVRFDE